MDQSINQNQSNNYKASLHAYAQRLPVVSRQSDFVTDRILVRERQYLVAVTVLLHHSVPS